jgi:hypothetical protein
MQVAKTRLKAAHKAHKAAKKNLKTARKALKTAKRLAQKGAPKAKVGSAPIIIRPVQARAVAIAKVKTADEPKPSAFPMEVSGKDPDLGNETKPPQPSTNLASAKAPGTNTAVPLRASNPPAPRSHSAKSKDGPAKSKTVPPSAGPRTLSVRKTANSSTPDLLRPSTKVTSATLQKPKAAGP